MRLKLNKIKNWQASVIIAVVGLAVYCSGLTNPFQGDDSMQIVNNVPVHSIAHIRLFFEGSTFYTGNGLAPLSGTYFRPLMTTVFSLLYTLFGPHPFYFHFLQLLLCIGSAIILYLFFRFSFKPALALLLALIFLVHPLNSQVAFYIPNMQDALFFFFGILALYLLIRFKSVKSLFLVALCLLLCLLSKESGILFVIMSLVCLFWYDRKRLYAFMGIMVLPIIAYVIVRIHAVGVFTNPGAAPIDSLGLAGRLMTAPSIMLFYVSKFIFPWKMASDYFWVYPRFSFTHVLVPLIIDLCVIGAVVYVGMLLRKKVAKARHYTYMFFGIWAAIGLLMCLNIIPLDTTASVPWFYFSMAGVLGMIGMVLTAYPLCFRPRWLIGAAVLLLVVLGVSTAVRGLAWRNPYTLAYQDISDSNDDFVAYNLVAEDLMGQGKYEAAKTYVTRSINIYPTYGNYNTLAEILGNQGDYQGAVNAYDHGIKLGGDTSLLYENLSQLALVYGSAKVNNAFFISALTKYPKDSALWMYLAIYLDRYGNNADAQIAITKAATYGQVPQSLYYSIMNNQTQMINLTSLGKSIEI